MNDPIFLELFSRLRDAGLPLGTADYHLLERALQSGIQVDSRTQLAQICCTLWVKSDQERLIFDDYFDQLVPDISVLTPVSTKNTVLTPPPQPTTSLAETSSPPTLTMPVNSKRPLQNWLPLIIGVGLLLLIIVLMTLPQTSTLLQRPFISPTPFRFEEDLLGWRFAVAHGGTARITIIRDDSQTQATSVVLTMYDTYSLVDWEEFWQLNRVDWLMAGENAEDLNISFDASRNNRRTILIPTRTTYHDYAQKIWLQLQDSNLKERALTVRGHWYGTGDLYSSVDFANIIINLICGLIVLVVFVIPILIQAMRTRYRRPEKNDTQTSDVYFRLPKSQLSQELVNQLTDEADIVRLSNNIQEKTRLYPLLSGGMPITSRQMKQAWRHLRHFSRTGSTLELDVDATIQQTSQQGMLLSPIFVPERRNVIELVLLLDWHGSMVAFHHIAAELVNTAQRGGRFKKVTVYYFHNCPDTHLYSDATLTTALPLDTCWRELHPLHTACLIFSDAGAARGECREGRLQSTVDFLQEVRLHTRHVAWLNPVPGKRWHNTTAGAVEKHVPMFEATQRGFLQAIDTLRGRQDHHD